jgi:hypothetical protein
MLVGRSPLVQTSDNGGKNQPAELSLLNFQDASSSSRVIGIDHFVAAKEPGFWIAIASPSCRSSSSSERSNGHLGLPVTRGTNPPTPSSAYAAAASSLRK